MSPPVSYDVTIPASGGITKRWIGLENRMRNGMENRIENGMENGTENGKVVSNPY